MQNILITGADGQLGSVLKSLAANYPEFKFYYTDIAELNITNQAAIDDFVSGHNITCILNTAGYTNADKAESDSEQAFLINGTAVGFLAESAKKNNALLIHISTDYVFGNNHFRPIVESASPYPLSVYAASKVDGEEKAIEHNPNTVILRTSWLHSKFGHNFVKTIIKLGNERDQLRVVFDQIGSPTYAVDLAQTILMLIPIWNKISAPEIYHYSNEGVASWYDFAVATLDLAGINCKIQPIETKDYPLPAARPHYSLLNKEKIKTKYGITIPHWQESLKKCIAEITKENHLIDVRHN